MLIMSSKASSQLPIRVKGETSCAVHHGSQLVFVCQTCSLPACVKCVSTVHRGHIIDDLEVVAARKREAMRINISIDIERELSKLDNEIISEKESIEDDLDNFETLDKKIIDNGEELKRKVDMFTEEQRRVCRQSKESNVPVLESYARRKKTAISKFKENVKLCKEVLQCGSDIMVYDTDVMPFSHCTSMKCPLMNTAKQTADFLHQTFNIVIMSCQREHVMDGTDGISSFEPQHSQESIHCMNACVERRQTYSTTPGEYFNVDASVDGAKSEDRKTSVDRREERYRLPDSAVDYAFDYTKKETESNKTSMGHFFGLTKSYTRTSNPQGRLPFDVTDRDTCPSDSANVFNNTKSANDPSAIEHMLNYTTADSCSLDSASSQEIDYIKTGDESASYCQMVDEFDAPDNDFIIYDIAPSNDGSVWVCCKNSVVVTKFDSSGNITEEIKFDDVVNCLSVSPITCRLWAGSGKEEHSIYEILSGVPSLKFEVDILQKCLCVLHDENVAIGMEDSVSMFTNDGELILSASVDGKPIRISECPKTNNIAVVLVTTKHTSSIVMMNDNLDELTTFSLVSSTISIIATNVVYDDGGDMLIAAMSQTDDSRNNVVLLRDGLLEESKTNLTVKAKGSSMTGCQHPVITLDKTGIMWTVFHEDINSPQHVQLLQYHSET